MWNSEEAKAKMIELVSNDPVRRRFMRCLEEDHVFELLEADLLEIGHRALIAGLGHYDYTITKVYEGAIEKFMHFFGGVCKNLMVGLFVDIDLSIRSGDRIGATIESKYVSHSIALEYYTDQRENEVNIKRDLYADKTLVSCRMDGQFY